jgi:hypothetical protein
MGMMRMMAAVGVALGLGLAATDAHAAGPAPLDAPASDPAPVSDLGPALPAISDLLKAKGPHAGNKGKGPKGRKQKEGWVSRPYIRPVAGVSVWGGSSQQTSTIATAGAEAGIVYRQVGRPLPRWRVTPRVRAQIYSSGVDMAGFHARTGVQAGPWWKHVGLSFGPDVYRDQLMIDRIKLDPVNGLAFPMMGLGRLGPVGAHVGVEPSWFLSGDRPGVDWSETDSFGFGDEFAYLAGANVRVQKMVVGVQWTRRITAAGEGTDWGFNAGFRL